MFFSASHTDKESKELEANAYILPPGKIGENSQEAHNNSSSIGHGSCKTSIDETKRNSLLYMYVLNQGTSGAFANVTYDNADVQLKVLQVSTY